LAYVLVCWYGARPLLLLVVRHLDLGAQKLSQYLISIILISVFASAMATSKLGIFAVFGGFMMGACCTTSATWQTLGRAKWPIW
jgi:Kef-type K+ transport system membrane component KefB